jgi:hypothetical protein
MKELHEYTNEDLIIYDGIRKILKDLHPKCFTGIDREIIVRCGKSLQVFRQLIVGFKICLIVCFQRFRVYPTYYDNPNICEL